MRRVFVFLLFAATAARADFPLNSAPLQPTSYSCSFPAAAAVASGPVVAWSEAIPKANRIHLRFNDGEDVIVDSHACPTCYGVTDVTANAREAFVGALGNLYRIDDATRRIVRLGAQPAGSLIRIVANGDFLLVVTSQLGANKVTLLDRDGNRLSDTMSLSAAFLYITSAVATSDGFAVVAQSGDDGSSHLVVLRIADLKAGKVGTAIAPAGVPAYSSMQIAADRNGFLATWAQRDRQFYAIVAGRLTPDGQPVGAPKLVAEYTNPVRPVSGRALAASPGGFALLASIDERDYSFVFFRLREDGTLLDSVDIAAGSNSGSLVFDGDTAVIASLPRLVTVGVHVTRIAPDDALSDAIVSLSRPVQRTIALFPTASGYAAVWTESYAILFGRFTASGAPLDGDGITIAAPVYRDVSAASNGDAVLIVWGSYFNDPHTAFVPLSDPTKFTTRMMTNDPGMTPMAVVAAGRAFVVAWTAQTWEVHARFVSAADGSIDSEMHTVIRLPWQTLIPQWVTVSAPRVAWNGAYFLFAWQQPQHWEDVYYPQGTAPRQMEKGDPFVQLVSPSLMPIGPPADLGHGPQDHTDFAGLNVTAMADGWLATWLRTGDAPALLSARLDIGGTTRDPIGGSVVPWGGAIVPPVLGATRFGGLRANGTRFDSILADGRTLPFTELPENAVIDAVCLECPLPSIAYSRREDDGSERAVVGALTARRHGAAAR